MADTPGYLQVRAADGSVLNVNVTKDQNGAATEQVSLRLADGTLVGPTIPLPMVRPPFAFTGQQSGVCNAVAGVVSASPIVPFSATRKVLHLFNRSTGTEIMDVGPTAALIVGGGIPIFAGSGFTFDGQGASGPFYAISPVAGTPFSYVEG